MIKKKLLIIDDSEIDREILKNILYNDFDIVETDNGYAGLEIILSGRPRVDAVLLDISMPVLDGFKVLQLMEENKIQDLPVVLITAEATKENVQKAVQYNVPNFIIKPFEPQTIMDRLNSILDIQSEIKEEAASAPRHTFTDSDLYETHSYIASLNGVFKGYLKNTGRSPEPYDRVADLMEILLNEYSVSSKRNDLDGEHITIISQAAEFYDIGIMAIPDALVDAKDIELEDKNVYVSHTTLGADLVWSNHSLPCRYFVEICADMCMHHHERYDGRGYPHGLNGNDNSIYTQLCSLAINFDKRYSTRPVHNSRSFDMVVSELRLDSGAFNPELVELLESAQASVISYYRKTEAE